MAKRRIGIIGYGNLGKCLVDEVLDNPSEFELAFVWNRSRSVLYNSDLDRDHILANLDDFESRRPDLVVEVAHPSISHRCGESILKFCDYMIGSPCALADTELERKLKYGAKDNGLYVPSGAFWGGEDIKKMADAGTLKGLKVTMTKHPSSFKLEPSEVKVRNDELLRSNTTKAVILYDGPVRGICPLAPNNVNTMAAAAVAGHNLGFVDVRGCLKSDPSLTDWHIVEIEVTGPTMDNGRTFTVSTVRKNPANPGAVSGSATYESFVGSMRGARGKGPGVHLC